MVRDELAWKKPEAGTKKVACLGRQNHVRRLESKANHMALFFCVVFF